jgi:hypothetical protein
VNQDFTFLDEPGHSSQSLKSAMVRIGGSGDKRDSHDSRNNQKNRYSRHNRFSFACGVSFYLNPTFQGAQSK